MSASVYRASEKRQNPAEISPPASLHRRAACPVRVPPEGVSAAAEGELPGRGKRSRPGRAAAKNDSTAFRACGRETPRGFSDKQRFPVKGCSPDAK